MLIDCHIYITVWRHPISDSLMKVFFNIYIYMHLVNTRHTLNLLPEKKQNDYLSIFLGYHK